MTTGAIPFKAATRSVIFTVISLSVLAGCADGAGSVSRQATGINDPYEERNRRTHEFNKRIASGLSGDTPTEETRGTPPLRPLGNGLRNLSNNLTEPGRIVNNLLQLRIENAGHNTFRFVINSTFGIAGIFDPARSIGLERRDTDFGETLHVWGANEGAYLEVPFTGPSTQRDFAGDIVDLVINPFNFVLSGQELVAYYLILIAGGVSEAARYSDAITDLLENSADSYSQAQLIYLQNRRFELGRNAGQRPGDGAPTADDPYTDPYADPYGDGADTVAADPFTDPYFDPYEDPYAQ